MKKLTTMMMGAVVALAACTDADPVGLSADVALHSDHVWQAGNGAAWHGYLGPDVEFDPATGLLCATWADEYLFERDEGAFADTDHFSFEFDVEEDEEWVEVADVNAKESPGDYTACLDLSEWEDGTYPFRVKGNAKHGTGQETTTHHTKYAAIEVTIGAAWSVELVGGSAQNLEQNANANQLTVVYNLYHGTTLITDCAVVPDVEWAADVSHHNCDAATGDRNLGLENPTRGTAGTFDLDFHWDDPSSPFASFEIMTTEPGGGAASSAVSTRGARK